MIFSFIKNNISITEKVLLFGGFLFIVSVFYIAFFNGSLNVNFLAKAFYIIGSIMLLYKT